MLRWSRNLNGVLLVKDRKIYIPQHYVRTYLIGVGGVLVAEDTPFIAIEINFLTHLKMIIPAIHLRTQTRANDESKRDIV